MINHGWSILCESVIIDKDSNNISLINCVEQINTPGLPVQFHHLTFSTYWFKSDQNDKINYKITLRVILESPDRGDITIGNINGVIKTPRHRFNFNIGGLPFLKDGPHYFRLEAKYLENDWGIVSRLPLVVVYSPPDVKIERAS